MDSTYPATGGPTFQTFRFWDTGTSWAQIEDHVPVNQNDYNFQTFDTWMSTVVPSNFDVIYTIGKTPNFISSAGTMDSVCNAAGFEGDCDPPKDLTCSGLDVANTGGTDQTFKTFLHDLWTHIKAQPYYGGNPLRHWYVEVWNEPTGNQSTFWDNDWIKNNWCGGDVSGPRRILARMASDARATIRGVDANVQFLSPPPADAHDQTGPGSWWYNYLGGDGGQWGKVGGAVCSGFASGTDPCGGGQFADIISLHEYHDPTNPDLTCCGSGTAVDSVRQALTHFNQISKPVFFTEAGWGGYCQNGVVNNTCTGFDPVSFVGRFYTLMASEGKVARLAWYNYDTSGPFWCSTKFYLNGPGPACSGSIPKLSTAGKALNLMQSTWGYTGGVFDAGGCATVAPTNGCANTGNFRVCGLTKGNGVSHPQARVVWFDSYNNSCAYTPTGTGWTQYRDLYGNVTGYSTGSVTVGNSPILFEK